MKYKTILADPPWNESGGGKIKRGADRHYPLMKTQEIIDMKDMIGDISEDNSHLYLWVTNNFLKDGLKVMDEWSYRYVTNIAWVKGGNIGLGQYFRGCHELCLFGVKGMLPYKVIKEKRQQGVTVINAKKRKHSKKPEEMRRMIELVSYAPRIELFARERYEGWDAWGDQIEDSIQERLDGK